MNRGLGRGRFARAVPQAERPPIHRRSADVAHIFRQRNREFVTMAEPVTYTFRRGASIRLELDALSGDVGIVQSVKAELRKGAPGTTNLNGGEPAVAAFTTTPRAAAGDVPAGWSLAISATDSAKLAKGIYIADARLIFSATDADVSERWLIEIEEPATRP